MNISSIIIQTLPQNIESVLKAVNESDFCDYEVHNDIGKIFRVHYREYPDPDIRCLKLVKRIEIK